MAATPGTAPASGQKVYYRQTGTFEYSVGFWFPQTGTIGKVAAWNDPTAAGSFVDYTEIDWVAAT